MGCKLGFSDTYKTKDYEDVFPKCYIRKEQKLEEDTCRKVYRNSSKEDNTLLSFSVRARPAAPQLLYYPRATAFCESVEE